jgi:predicted Zn-dependent protease
MDDARADWHEQRRRAVDGHAAALAAAREAEATKAAELLTDFVRRAAERGLAPETLTARSLNGHATYRTRLRGWYLKANRSVAVGEDGRFYVLTVPPSVRARLTGAVVEPSMPRLIIGAGGGDGETMPLAELLKRRLDAGRSWP